LDADHPENGVLIPCRCTIRAFDSAEAAMAFLERQSVAAVPAAGRTGRVLPAKAAWAAEIARSRLCGRPRVASGD